MTKADKPKKTGRKIVFGVIGAIVLIVIIASASHSKTTVTTTASTNKLATTATNAKKAADTAKIGDTINIGGSKGVAVNVTLIDPAQGASQYTTPDAGKRFVGVKLQITNNGTSGFQNNANTDVTLIGSDNQSYTADFSDITGCTNFSSGSFTLASGASATGCVVFQVPNEVTTAKVQFAPDSGFSGDTGEWQNQ